MIILLFFVLLVFVIYLLFGVERTEEDDNNYTRQDHQHIHHEYMDHEHVVHTHVYRLPFPVEARYPVCTSYCEGTHTDTWSFAVDFMMPEGALICAIREGHVSHVKDNSSLGGADPTYDDDCNRLTIIHPGGESASVYLHLAQYSVRKLGIKQGDYVRTGQPIARVGSTGWTTFPHLHYSVYWLEVLDTIPFWTRTNRGIVDQLETGVTYGH